MLRMFYKLSSEEKSVLNFLKTLQKNVNVDKITQDVLNGAVKSVTNAFINRTFTKDNLKILLQLCFLENEALKLNLLKNGEHPLLQLAFKQMGVIINQPDDIQKIYDIISTGATNPLTFTLAMMDFAEVDMLVKVFKLSSQLSLGFLLVQGILFYDSKHNQYLSEIICRVMAIACSSFCA